MAGDVDQDLPGPDLLRVVFGVVTVIARRGRPTPWPTLAWLGVFFLIGVYAARGIAWWPLAAATAVAGLLAPDPAVAAAEAAKPEPETPRAFRRLNAAIVVIFVLVGIVLLPIWRPVDARTEAPTGILLYAPPGITAKLREIAKPGDRVFNPRSGARGSSSRCRTCGSRWTPDRVLSATGLARLQRGHRRQRRLGAADRLVGSDDRGDGQAGPGRRRPVRQLGWKPVYTDEDGTIMVAPDR